MERISRREVWMSAALFLVIISASGCAANSGAKDPPSNEVRGFCSETAGKCAETSPPPVQPAPQQENRGVVNPRTGEYLQPSGKGVYNPRTGDYYIPSGNGYYNPRTGEFIPRKP